jgi:hypothetical protein
MENGNKAWQIAAQISNDACGLQHDLLTELDKEGIPLKLQAERCSSREQSDPRNSSHSTFM